MRKLFQHIRRQPKHIRDNYAFGVAASFTALVLVFWGVARVDEGLVDVNFVSDESKAPFATLIKESKERFSALKGNADSSSDSQTAGVINSENSSTTESTNASSIILSSEEIEALNANRATSSQANQPEPMNEFVEVMIGTTTSSSSQVSASTTIQ
jgi:hypothetical protein